MWWHLFFYTFYLNSKNRLQSRSRTDRSSTFPEVHMQRVHMHREKEERERDFVECVPLCVQDTMNMYGSTQYLSNPFNSYFFYSYLSDVLGKDFLLWLNFKVMLLLIENSFSILYSLDNTVFSTSWSHPVLHIHRILVKSCVQILSCGCIIFFWISLSGLESIRCVYH